MRCLVVIPAFNEEASLPAVLRELAACGYGYDVVVIDDCSRDRTAAVARAAGATVLAHPRNLGYRHALRTGMRHALGGGYEALVFLDADGQHRPAAIGGLVLRAAAADRPDVVIGSRYVGLRRYGGPLGRRLGRQAFSLLASGAASLLRREPGLRIWDTTSGLKLLRRAALERLIDAPFCDLHAEAIVYLQAAGLRLVEVPVEIDEAEAPGGHAYRFRLRARSFLHNQVRGIVGTLERVRRRQQPRQTGRLDELERHVEASSGLTGPIPAGVGELLGAVGVRSDQLDLALPQRRQVRFDHARHADHDDSSGGAGDGEGGGDAVGGTDAVDGDVGSAGQTPGPGTRTEDHGAGVPTHGPGELVGAAHHVRSERASQLTLVWMLCPDDHGALSSEVLHCGEGQQPERSRSDDGDGVAGTDPGAHCSMDGACGGLDEHRSLVGHALRNRVQLARVRHHGSRPAAAGVAAEPGLQSRVEATVSQVLAIAQMARGAGTAVSPQG